MAQLSAPGKGDPINPNQPPNPTTTTDPAGNGTQPQRKRRKRKRRRKNFNNEAGTGNSGGGPTVNNVSGQETSANTQKAQSVQQFPRPQQPVKEQPQVPARAFPRFLCLPPELQRHIFDIAASDKSWRNRRFINWVYISRNVREWVEPYIYDSIELPSINEWSYWGQKKLESVERAFQYKPREFFARNVRRVFTFSRPEFGENGIEPRLLSACDNLEVLECWSTPRKALTDVLMNKSWPKLKVLCLNIDLLPKDENTFHFPLFQHITHLDLRSEEEAQLPSWKGLQSLESLTHMRINTMEKYITWEETTHVVDQACFIASEVRKYCPPNLQHFVILIPIDMLYYICIGSTKYEDEERWKTIKSIRIGDFDERIMLGCHGDSEIWFDRGGLRKDDEDYEEHLTDFGDHDLYTTPMIINPTQPRDDPLDHWIWGEVEGKNKCGMRKRAEEFKTFVKTRRTETDDDDESDCDSE